MPERLNQLLLILVLVAINAFFAAAEIAVISMRSVRVRQLAEQGNRSAQILEKLVADPSRFLATIQVGITLAGFMASAAAAVGIAGVFRDLLRLIPIPLIARNSSGLAVIIVTLAVSYVTLVAGELAPKRLALQHTESIALRVARPIALLSTLTAPFTRFLTYSTNLVVRGLGGKVQQEDRGITEEEIRIYVAEHQTLPDEEKRMIHSIFEFGDRVVRQVMVPRTDIEALCDKATVTGAMELLREKGFSRYPVFRENLDDIVGLVSVRELVSTVAAGSPDRPVTEIMRPVLFIPETKKTVELLKELRSQKASMAIVVDEFGGTAGLVTMEDLLDEIVGDIGGNPADDLIETLTPDEVVVGGRTGVDEINDRLDLALPVNGEYETIAGFVMERLGRIPKDGDKLTFHGATLEVLKMDRRRIEEIKITHPGRLAGRVPPG